MTKQEFENLFNSAFKSTLEENSQNVLSALKQNADEHGKIPTDELALTLFIEGFKMNSLFLKRLLEDVLEFDS